ncbi:hypothetical protein HPB48_022558 [Haemaphysalis longicornis]|uniref:Uncharacterized protein n=1 Tax=Haemaphysalis longicornis TaxID=44386 RepID=A0A9J6FC24_HAELO|nr:hypothetical protein HPB48_022558 [Haemaphysalis longicornis]
MLRTSPYTCTRTSLLSRPCKNLPRRRSPAPAASTLQTKPGTCVYEMPPEDSCKGVVHGIDAGTPTSELMANLCAPGTDIINARMMGRSETAIITFRGTYIPPYVLLYMAKYRCKPHKPKAQFCNTCYCIGHRADVCPQAGSQKCKKCGKLLDEPDQQHECHMNCVNCHGEHPADYEDCLARREADAETTKAAYLKRIKLRKNQQEQVTQKQVHVQDPKTHEQHPKSQPLQRNHASRVSRPNQRDARQGRSNSCNSTPGTRRARSLSAGRRNTEVSRPAFLPLTPTRHPDKRTHRNEHKPIWQSQSYKQAVVRKKNDSVNSRVVGNKRTSAHANGDH